LKEDPQVSEGYKVLGLAYGILDRIEGGVMAEGQSEWGHMLRYYQAVAALQQAKGLDPNDAKVRWGLLTQYQKSKRSELALETIQGMRQLPEYSVETSLLSVEERQARAELNDLALTLSEAVSKIDETTAQIQERAAQQAGGVDKFQLAMVGAQNGGVRFAIKTLEDDAPYLAQNPSAKLLLGNFLIETGRVREGHELLSDVEAISARGGGAGWQDAVTISALTNGDYSRAKRIRADQIRSSEEEVGPTNIGTLPFLTLNQYWMASDQYPMAHVASVMQRFDTVFNQNAFNRFELALIQIEDGDVAAAAKTLKQLIALDPNTPRRPLIRFYLFCLTDEMLDMKPPAREAPEEFAPLDNEVAGK
jgi:tetratricopeptide (TPR) repeat protein